MGAALGVAFCGVDIAASAAGCLACCAARALCSACMRCCCPSWKTLCCCCRGSGKDAEGSATPAAPPPAGCGNVGSLLLTLFSIGLALWVQYWGASRIEGLWMWEENCNDSTESYEAACKGAAGVYRVSFVNVVFFLTMAVAVRLRPALHNGWWGPKVLLWLALATGAAFTPNSVFDTNGYAWFARCGAGVFIILQQVILIDCAYQLNDYVVTLSNEDGDEGFSGRLQALLALSVLLFAAAFTCIVLLFVYFGACQISNAFTGTTLALLVVATAVQLFVSNEGNLLSSAVVACYAVFLNYSALSTSPSHTCNPLLQDDADGGDHASSVARVVPVALTVLSLGWVSYSASKNIAALWHDDDAEEAADLCTTLNQSLLEDGERGGAAPVAQPNPLVTDQPAAAAPPPPVGAVEVDTAGARALSAAAAREEQNGDSYFKYNLVMALISMYLAMALTNWATLQDAGSVHNPASGLVAMWMQIVAQWVAVLLYSWTLAAPVLMPDRDFG